MPNQWDIYAEIFNEGVGSGGDKLHTEIIDPIIFEFLGDYQGKTIFDAACGNGYLVKKLAAQSKRVVGLDYSSKLLEIARENLKGIQNCEFVQGDLTKPLPFEDNQFDVVIANMVLQYLPELNTFASETFRILKNLGMLIVITDHPAHALFLRAQELIGKKNEKFLTSGSYFESGKRTKKSLWDKAILEYYHRPVKDYLNPFTPHFKLEKIEEATEDGEMPRILALKFRKG